LLRKVCNLGLIPPRNLIRSFTTSPKPPTEIPKLKALPESRFPKSLLKDSNTYDIYTKLFKHETFLQNFRPPDSTGTTYYGNYGFAPKCLEINGGQAKVTINTQIVARKVPFDKDDDLSHIHLMFNVMLKQQVPNNILQTLGIFLHVDKLNTHPLTLTTIHPKLKTYHDVNTLDIHVVFSQLETGLNTLHDNSVIHSDIKPDNILFSKDKKTAYISDLSIVPTCIKYPVTIATPIYSCSAQIRAVKQGLYPSKEEKIAWDYYSLAITILDMYYKQQGINFVDKINEDYRKLQRYNNSSIGSVPEALLINYVTKIKDDTLKQKLINYLSNTHCYCGLNKTMSEPMV